MEKENSRIVIYVIIFVVIAIVNIAFKKKKSNIAKQKTVIQSENNSEQYFPEIESENVSKKQVFKSDLNNTIKDITIKSNNVTNVKVIDYFKTEKVNKTESTGINFTPEELKKAIIYSEILKPLDLL